MTLNLINIVMFLCQRKKYPLKNHRKMGYNAIVMHDITI